MIAMNEKYLPLHKELVLLSLQNPASYTLDDKIERIELAKEALMTFDTALESQLRIKSCEASEEDDRASTIFTLIGHIDEFLRYWLKALEDLKVTQASARQLKEVAV